MASIGTLVDLGCGLGHDTEWWASRTARDEVPVPLNIKCVGVDLHDRLSAAKKYPNVSYQKTNFEETIHTPAQQLFDVLWCFDAFQYCVNPLETLKKWKNIASEGAMLAISVPDTMTIRHRQLAFTQQPGCYYHHTMVSLIHMLAVTGWDCGAGFFSKRPGDPWTHAVVYKSSHPDMDPKTTTWHQLAEMKLLPESAAVSVQAHNYLRQQDLVVPWLDHSLTDMSQL
jgi:SAM-dependent methyltransferase